MIKKISKIMLDWFVNNADWIVIIGGVVTLAGTIFLNIKSSQESDLNKLEQQKILEQSVNLNNLLTGGDAYPYVTFQDVDFEFGVAQYVISNQGKYPLNIPQVTITDDRAINRILSDPSNQISKGIDGELLAKYTKYINVGEILPKHSFIMNTFPFQFENNGSYTLRFSLRNGTFYQTFLTVRGNGKWIIANKLTSYPSNKVIDKYIPNDFPKDLLKW